MAINEGGWATEILELIQQVVSSSGGQAYENNPLGFLGFNTKFQLSPVMGMLQQFAPGLMNKFPPFIPYNTSMYQYEIMRTRKEQESKMQVPMASPLFNRLYRGGLENVMRYSPLQAAQSMYAPGGVKGGMYEAMSNMWGQTFGPMIEPDSYLSRHRPGLSASFQGLRIHGEGGQGGYYGGLSNAGIKSLEKGIGNNMGKGGLLRGYNVSDWADIARMSVDFGELASTEGPQNIDTINKKIENIGKSIKLGMSVFNTMNKSEIMQTIKNITMGEISVSNFEGVGDVLSKLTTLSAKADKSIKFMTKVAQEGASLYKQMGYSGMAGLDYILTSRSNFIGTSGLSDKYVSSVGGEAQAFNIETQGHLGIMSSGLTKKIMGSYEILRSNLGTSAVSGLRKEMMTKGYTPAVLRKMETMMSEAGISGDVMRSTTSYAGAGMTSFIADAGKTNANILQRLGGIKGIVNFVETNIGKSIDQLFEENDGNVSAVKQRIHSVLVNTGQISEDVARHHAETIVSIRNKGENLSGGFDAYANELTSAATETKLEQERYKIAEKLRPAKMDIMKRLLQSNFEEASLGDIGKNIFKGRDTLVSSALFIELNKEKNDPKKLFKLASALSVEGAMNKKINKIRGMSSMPKSTLRKISGVYAAQIGGVDTGLTDEEKEILAGEIDQYGLEEYFSFEDGKFIAKGDMKNNKDFTLQSKQFLEKLKNESKTEITLDNIFEKNSVKAKRLTIEQFKKIKEMASKKGWAGISAAIGEKTFEAFNEMKTGDFIKAIRDGLGSNEDVEVERAVNIAALYANSLKKNEKEVTENMEVDAKNATITVENVEKIVVNGSNSTNKNEANDTSTEGPGG